MTTRLLPNGFSLGVNHRSFVDEVNTLRDEPDRSGGLFASFMGTCDGGEIGAEIERNIVVQEVLIGVRNEIFGVSISSL